MILTVPGIERITVKPDKMIIVTINLLFLNQLKIVIGIIFCKVLIRKRTHKSQVFKIEINQKWKGAAPSFSNIAKDATELDIPGNIKKKKFPDKKAAEPHA